MNEHEKIIALRNKYNYIHDKAKAEKRALNEFERVLVAEIKAAINDLEAIVPQKPLTVNGISRL